MASIETKYGLGDEVWIISERRAEREVRCLTCVNSGKVSLGGEEFICPKCNGKSRHRQYAGDKWIVAETGKVGQIRAVLTAREYVRATHEEREVQYMADTTGVGSGSLWDESKCWPSREAAEAECERRNADTNWADDT